MTKLLQSNTPKSDMEEALTNLLFELERHCNNYFNPRNDPADPERNYPPAFLELASRIAQFRKKQTLTTEGGAVAVVAEAGRSVHFAQNEKLNLPWQEAFARELAIYKRVKFIW